MTLFARTLSTLILIGLFGGLALPAQAQGTTYSLDPNHTQVRFTWNHFGFSNPGASFDIEKGTLHWDADDPEKSSVKVIIPVASLDTRVPALDAKLKSVDFFDADKYPTITFTSTGVQRDGESRHYRIDGKLTIHGTTRPATLRATLNKVGEHPMLQAPAIGFDATTTVKRSNFGLGAYTPLVGDLVTIHITVEALAPKALQKEEKQIKAMSPETHQNRP